MDWFDLDFDLMRFDFELILFDWMGGLIDLIWLWSVFIGLDYDFGLMQFWFGLTGSDRGGRLIDGLVGRMVGWLIDWFGWLVWTCGLILFAVFWLIAVCISLTGFGLIGFSLISIWFGFVWVWFDWIWFVGILILINLIWLTDCCWMDRSTNPYL